MDNIVGIEFYNRTATTLWIEPFCIEVELQPEFEYRVESTETEYGLKMDHDTITFYLQKAYSPKVYRRPVVANVQESIPWELIEDYSFLDL
ncbi:hypothetical protein [Hymenobacter edaphi]|uniref:Uncharacterized protein n=1 Tax=Hymenobacter edaphi TaxID=2211146 RepID=A0A328BRP0_9BACT|nr:hypothetical protein [Hymenobacter edaphi]RAK69922.1 hypothetical protein DLM85_03450 [Hymenobacter edaphi]